jgi:hypothetical protein
VGRQCVARSELFGNFQRQVAVETASRVDRRKFLELVSGLGGELAPFAREIGFLSVGL